VSAKWPRNVVSALRPHSYSCRIRPARRRHMIPPDPKVCSSRVCHSSTFIGVLHELGGCRKVGRPRPTPMDSRHPSTQLAPSIGSPAGNLKLSAGPWNLPWAAMRSVPDPGDTGSGNVYPCQGPVVVKRQWSRLPVSTVLESRRSDLCPRSQVRNGTPLSSSTGGCRRRGRRFVAGAGFAQAQATALARRERQISISVS